MIESDQTTQPQQGGGRKGDSAMQDKIGFAEFKKINGMLYFTTHDIDGLTVQTADKAISGRTGKPYIKRAPLSYKTGTIDATQAHVRMYAITMYDETVEFTLNGETATLRIERGKLTWQ